MSQSEFDRFVADLKANADLRASAEKMRTGESPARLVDIVVSFAAAKGYGFTAEDVMERAKAKAKDARRLTDTELDGVVGGGGLDPAELRFEFSIGDNLSPIIGPFSLEAPDWEMSLVLFPKHDP